MVKPKQAEVVVERRRTKSDRRTPVATGASKPQFERRKVQRRRQIDPTTCERDYSNDEVEFMQALDAYKRTSGRMFPTCSEILEVIRNLGYVRLGGEAEVAASEWEADFSGELVEGGESVEGGELVEAESVAAT